ncbi:hypothetical protein C8R45DRAFT_940508 [Mycena sanguinolenta]|nr:hypothetical protein C8R45DRAFT_940508 [Mycena sanguinolenta]
MGWPTRTTLVLRSPSPELEAWYFIYQLALSGTVSVSTKIPALISIRIAIQPMQKTTSWNIRAPQLAMTMILLDAEFSQTQENVHDLVSGDGGSKHAEIANCEDYDVQSFTEEMFAPSRSFNILLGVRLALILFHGLSWVYDHVAVSFV